jgi:hypothetical protein
LRTDSAMPIARIEKIMKAAMAMRLMVERFMD